MNSVIEFICDLCGNQFHELQGAKCVNCDKLVCPDCKNIFPEGAICVKCKKLMDFQVKKP